MSKQVKALFKENKFGIRKFSVGVASVIVGTTMYIGLENHNEAHAAETEQPASIQQGNQTQSAQNNQTPDKQATNQDTSKKVQTQNVTDNQTNTQQNMEQTINTQQKQDVAQQPQVQNKAVNTQNQSQAKKGVHYTSVSITNEQSRKDYEQRRDAYLTKQNQTQNTQPEAVQPKTEATTTQVNQPQNANAVNTASTPKVRVLAATPQAGRTGWSSSSGQTAGSYNGNTQITHEDSTPIPFETTRQQNDQLTPGTEKVKTEGRDGKHITGTEGNRFLTNRDDSKPDALKEYNDTHDNEVVNKGTNQLKQQYGDDVQIGDITYTNVHDYDPDYYKNEATKGYVIPFKSTKEITVAPKNQVVEYGPEIKENTSASAEKFNTKRDIDWTLDPGADDVVVQQGKVGTTETTTKYFEKAPSKTITDKLNGQTLNDYYNGLDEAGKTQFNQDAMNDLTDETKTAYPDTTFHGITEDNQLRYDLSKVSTTTEPTDEIIHYAPEMIPFEIQYRTNPELKDGEERTVQQGQIGLKDPTSGEVHQQPSPKIIERGIDKSEITTKTEMNAESKPFKVITRNNPDLEEGITRIVTPGQNGVVVTTTEQDYDKDGNKVGDPRVTTETTKEAVDQIIEVGTKKADQPVDPNTKPTNDNHQPKGGTITKDHGQPTTPDEVISHVSTPGYHGEKPVITIDNPKQIPNGTVDGDHKVSVTVKYPDGSTDHTIVTVHVNPTNGATTPSEAHPPVNPDHSHDHDGVHDMTPHDDGNGGSNGKVTPKETNQTDGFNGTVTPKPMNVSNTHGETPTTSVNGHDVAGHTEQGHVAQASEGGNHASQVREQAIEKIMQDKHVSREDAVKHHSDAIDKAIQKSDANALPETGQEGMNGGLIASIIAAIGLGTIFTARRKKTNE